MEKSLIMLVLRGLMGSGKSTRAYEWVSEDPEWRIRVNRDDLRYQSFKKYHGLTRLQEETITSLEHALVESALKSCMSVVIDDTNLRSSTVKDFLKIAKKYHAEVLVEDIDTSLEECISRDAQRDKKVGEDVIRNFHNRYFKKGKFPPVPSLNDADSLENLKAYVSDSSKPKAVWVDVDSTVARRVEKGGSVRGPFDWHRVGEDDPIEHVIDAVKALKSSGYKIVIMSGRDEVCKPETSEWLLKHGVEFDDIFMRPKGSMIKDNKVKYDLFWEHVAPKYDIKFALDDRQQVVDYTRNVLKIPVFQVEKNEF